MRWIFYLHFFLRRTFYYFLLFFFFLPGVVFSTLSIFSTTCRRGLEFLASAWSKRLFCFSCGHGREDVDNKMVGMYVWRLRSVLYRLHAQAPLTCTCERAMENMLCEGCITGNHPSRSAGILPRTWFLFSFKHSFFPYCFPNRSLRDCFFTVLLPLGTRFFASLVAETGISFPTGLRGWFHRDPEPRQELSHNQVLPSANSSIS